MMSRFPYILFDLGGTLIFFEGNWRDSVVNAMEKTTQSLRAMGYDLDPYIFPAAYYNLTQDYYKKRNDQWIEFTADTVLRRALQEQGYVDVPDQHLHRALAVFYGLTQASWHPESDAASTLEKLRSFGCRLGIVSNASYDQDVQALVDNAQLRHYFDFIYTSARSGVRKPNPRIFQEALSFWKAAPEQAVMVGDLVSADVAGANNLGIASVWITRRADSKDNHIALEHHAPNAVISALSELPALLENWPGNH